MAHDEDIVVHKNTFSGFVSLMTWGALTSIVLGFIVILLISHK